jgi:hypothetical protein
MIRDYITAEERINCHKDILDFSPTEFLLKITAAFIVEFYCVIIYVGVF